MEISGFTAVSKAAEMIGRTNKRIYQLIEEEKLDAVRLGREYLVKLKSVEAYLKKRNGTKAGVSQKKRR